MVSTFYIVNFFIQILKKLTNLGKENLTNTKPSASVMAFVVRMQMTEVQVKNLFTA